MSTELHTQEDMANLGFTWQQGRRDAHRLLCNNVRRLKRELSECNDAAREEYLHTALRCAQQDCRKASDEMRRIAARYEDLAQSFAQVRLYMESDTAEANK